MNLGQPKNQIRTEGSEVGQHPTTHSRRFGCVVAWRMRNAGRQLGRAKREKRSRASALFLAPL